MADLFPIVLALLLATNLIYQLHRHHYDDRQFLGSGGFGQVYLTNHSHLGATAMKTVNRDEPSELGIIEYLGTISVDCPWNVQYYDVAAGDSRTDIYMEYIGGGHLGQLWLDVYGEEGDYHLWIYIAGELIRAVHCLHSHDIVHRDIKLENVMSRGVRIVDFGLACRLDSCSRTTIGTRIYRPYNTSSGLDLATRLVSDDIWAVGITLHLLAHPEAKAALILGRPIVVPHSADRGLVGDVLYQLLEADPLLRIKIFQYLINSL